MRLAGVATLSATAAVGALAFGASAGARSSSTPHADTAASSHLQVTQLEYRLMLSRGVVRAGPVGVEAIDGGMDPHDLRMRRVASGRETVTPQLTPGERWDGVVNLRPGVYHLWCSLPEHAKRGMRATLVVVR